MKRENTRVIIQGFGDVGSMAAHILYGAGYSVIGVSDIHGGIVNTLGINITKLMAFVQETKTVVGFPDAEPISGEELLVQSCDILLLPPPRTRSPMRMRTSFRLASFAKVPTVRLRRRRMRSYSTKSLHHSRHSSQCRWRHSFLL